MLCFSFPELSSYRATTDCGLWSGALHNFADYTLVADNISLCLYYLLKLHCYSLGLYQFKQLTGACLVKLFLKPSLHIVAQAWLAESCWISEAKQGNLWFILGREANKEVQGRYTEA